MIEYHQALPKTYPLLAKALLQRGKLTTPCEALPSAGIRVNELKLDTRHLRAFARSIGSTGEANYAPLIYPQVMCFPLHLKLMTQSNFPYKVMGVVHMKNRVEQLRKIPLSEELTLESQFSTIEQHPRGQLFTIASTVKIAGETVWKNDAQYLKIFKKSDPQPGKTSDNKETQWQSKNTQRFDVKAGTGRRYARVSGDFNPIHLTDFSAKLFGMRSSVVHGVWTLAKIFPLLDTQREAIRVSSSFKRAILQPSTVNLVTGKTDRGLKFEVQSDDHRSIHLSGECEEI